MDEKKQIEEMKKIFCATCGTGCSDCKILELYPTCFADEYARSLYAAGYHKQEWISVDERMPEEKSVERLQWDSETLALLDTDTDLVSDEVLVTVVDHEREDRVFVATDCTVNGQWANFYEVTHWMPFPNSPEINGGAE